MPITPTQQQIGRRWNILPQEIRDAFFADTNDDSITKLCQSEHLSKEKTDDVFIATGYVLMGFIHPEDLAEELSAAVGLPPQVAAAISGDIDKRIFAPIKGSLEKIFSPPGEPEGGPKIIRDVSPTPAPSPAPPPVPVPGWSRSVSGAEPVIKLSEQPRAKSPTPPPPLPNAAPKLPQSAPTAWSPSAPIAKGKFVDEFERLGLADGRGGAPRPPAPTAPTTPSAPKNQAAPEPAPVILNDNASFKARPQAPGFHLNVPEQPIDVKKTVTAPPPKPAVLEFGAAPTAAPSPRVVHYGEFKSPSPESPIRPKAQTPPPPPRPEKDIPRNITEITAEPLPAKLPVSRDQKAAPPKPAPPPSPAVPPKPAPPPSPPQKFSPPPPR